MSKTIITKTCRVCNITKPLSDFYKNARKIGGYKNNCKSCHRNHFNRYRKTEKGKEIIRKAQKKYYATEKGKTQRRRSAAKYKSGPKGQAFAIAYAQSDRGKTLAAKRMSRHRALYPEQQKALQAVRKAIKTGKLPRPDSLQCNYCPKQAKEYHHHLGYSQKHWLDVMPLCLSCHGKTCRLY